jgi:predicted dehydrogenase
MMQNIKKLKIAFIGCGAALQSLYLKPLKRLSDQGVIDVRLLIDPSPDRQRFAKKSFPSASISGDVRDSIANNKIDLTIVASPPPFHAEHSISAMQQGSNVLCEKPISDKVDSARMMSRVSLDTEKVISIGMVRRYYPCLSALKTLLASKELGQIVSYLYREGGVYAWPVTSPAPFNRVQSGGGVLLDKGVHVIDLLCWVFGQCECVSCYDDAWKNGVECNSSLLLGHGNISGRVVLSWDQDMQNGLSITCEKGEIFVPVGPMHDVFIRKEKQNWSRFEISSSWPASVDLSSAKRMTPRVYYDCFDCQLLEVIRSVLHGVPVPVSCDEAIGVMSVIETAYQIAKPLQQPWLSSLEQDVNNCNHWGNYR